MLLSGISWLEALWKCRVEVIKAHGVAADENASQAPGLMPGLRLPKPLDCARGATSPA